MFRMNAILLMLIAAGSSAVFAQQPAQPEARAALVAKHSRSIMPFDLEQTLHIFSKTEQGGLQQVITKNADNTQQIVLIRAHLSKITRQFNQRNFSAPAALHGDNMPGLAVLKKARPGELHVDYHELENGAEISYSSRDPKLIIAIRQWFDAQLIDHGHHATQ